MTASAAIPSHVPPELVVDVDIYDLPGANIDPQMAWKALDRPNGPGLIWTPRHGGHWIATSATLLEELFPDTERLSNQEIAVPRGSMVYPMVPNQADAPEHTYYRRVVMPFVLPAAVRDLQDAVRALTIELIEGFRSRGQCEFMAEFARHLPMRIFLSLVDLPDTDREWLVDLAEVMARTADVEKRLQAQREMIGYLQKWIDERRAHPGNDLLSAIVHAKVGDRPMQPEEIMGEALDVMFGGLDTVASMMGFIMRFLATHPEHYRQLVASPALIPQATEELLRRHGVASLARVVVADITHNDITVPAGDMIILPTCLHGLDENTWKDAQIIDFNRQPGRQYTFGKGAHVCPGQWLARSEIVIMLEEWTRLIPAIGIAPDTQPIASSGGVNGVLKLELAWPV